MLNWTAFFVSTGLHGHDIPPPYILQVVLAPPFGFRMVAILLTTHLPLFECNSFASNCSDNEVAWAFANKTHGTLSAT